MHIFKHYKRQLRNLRNPHDIARLLYEEKIGLSFEKITSKEPSLEMDDIVHTLLTDMQIAIFHDHKVLLIFAQICMLTGNEDIGNDILQSCSKFLY